MDEPRLKLSELREHLDQIIKEHGDLDVSITLPGWILGADDPEALQHTWNFGIYILNLSDVDENGNEIKETIASLGHVGDYEIEEPQRPNHLSIVKE